ncbi:unnamed protein product [Sympodiomycopsis kandeliae]
MSGSNLNLAFENDRRNKPSGRPQFGRGFGGDDEEEEDDNLDQSSSRQDLQGYNRSGAESHGKREPPANKERVIPLVGGSDWRADRKKRLDLAAIKGPQQSQNGSTSNGGTVSGVDMINDEEQKVGLQQRSRRTDQEETSAMDIDQNDDRDKTPTIEEQPLTDDESARQALLSGQTTTSTINSHRIIAQSEEEAFRNDAESRPDAPSLDDYANTPVEEFGKALLRGMGWKEGMGAGKDGKGPVRPQEIKKRSALLGLGAKERPSSATSAGKDKRSSMSKRPDVRGYKPLVRREMDSNPASNSSSSSRNGDYESRSSSSSSSSSRRDDHRSSRHRSRSRSPTRLSHSSSSRHRDRDYHHRDESHRSRTTHRDADRDVGRDRNRNRDRTSSRRYEDEDRRRGDARERDRDSYR